MSYISLDNPVAARQFGAAFLDATERICEFPESGHLVPDSSLRACGVSSQFRRYQILYRRMDDETIEIVRVLHSARDISGLLADLS